MHPTTPGTCCGASKWNHVDRAKSNQDTSHTKKLAYKAIAYREAHHESETQYGAHCPTYYRHALVLFTKAVVCLIYRKKRPKIAASGARRSISRPRDAALPDVVAAAAEVVPTALVVVTAVAVVVPPVLTAEVDAGPSQCQWSP